MADKTDKKKGFNKKILTILIEKARGERTTRKFAQDCGISYVQLHKLELGLQDNPPGRKILTRLAENSAADIDVEDFMFACGVTEKEPCEKKESVPKSKSLDIQSLYGRLSKGQQKTVYDFVDYLLNYKKL